ncbi:alpha/beta hydrolase [Flavitalea antarctica]
MRKFTLSLLFCWYMLPVAAQDHRYRNLVFPAVSKEKNIYYGQPGAERRKRYHLDLYTPAKDSALNRPAIVLMHGGGFKFGSKNNSRMKIWGKHFARMGYVCVAVNYRLSKKKPLNRFNDLVEGCAEAVSDVDQAILYLKQNAVKLGVDTNAIILAGHSAGGMIALQSVYSSQAEMKHLIDASHPVPDQIFHNPRGVLSVVNFWGAIYDTTWLQNARVPIVSVHGSKDRVVPINYGETPMYGSTIIHRQAEKLKIPNAIKIFQGKGHELQRHFNPIYAGPVARKRWRQAADFAAVFLYKEFFNSMPSSKP